MELVKLFGLTVSCLLGLILIGRMLQLRTLLLALDLGVLDLLQLFFLMSPLFMLLIAPISCMLSVFLTFLRMSSDNELTALKASGVSLFRMLPAPLLFCALVTTLTYGVSFYGISTCYDAFKVRLVELARTKSRLAIQPGIFNQEYPNLTIYARKVDPATSSFKDIFVEDRTNRSVKVVVTAPSGQVHFDHDTGDIRIEFRNGSIFKNQGDSLTLLKFGKYSVRLPFANMVGGISLSGEEKPKEMSFAQLGELLEQGNADMRYSTRNFNKIHTEYYKRLTLPLGCFILGLFALPMAVFFQGLNQKYGLLLALVFFLVYYSVFSVGVSMGESGASNPGLALWVPNLLFALFSVMGFRYANLERLPSIVVWATRLRRRSA